MISRLLAVSLMLAACGGGERADDEPTPDTPPGGSCTGAVYDPCTDNTQCGAESVECRLFMQDGFQVCVSSCTPGDNETCPVDETGARGECNNRGLCKPAAPNNCTR